MQKFFIVLSVSIMMLSCSKATRQALDRAEDVLANHPDSSVMILSAISPEELTTRALRARHALLLSMAVDGGGEAPGWVFSPESGGNQEIPAQDGRDESVWRWRDSVARVAYDYYTGRGSKWEKMHSAYCMASVEYEAGLVTGAILHYHEALQHAEKRNDVLMEGYICQKLGELFAMNYDHGEALSYASRATHCLETVGESLSADFSRMDMARQYLSMRNLEKAEEMADAVLTDGMPEDAGLAYYLCLLKADIAVNKGDNETALRYYSYAEGTGHMLPLSSYGNYYFLADTPKADSLLTLMLGNVKSGVDSMVFFEFLTERDRLRGDYEEAYKNLNVVDKIQDRVYSSIISQSTNRALKAYFQEQLTAEQQRRRAQLYLSSLVILILLLVIAVVIMLLRRRRMQIEEEMSRVEQLSRDLRLMRVEAKRSDDIAGTLVSDKLRSMSLLAETYLNWSDEAVHRRENRQGRFGKEEIIAQFRSELADLRSDKRFLHSLEDMLNRQHDGVIEQLHRDFSGVHPDNPVLNETDFVMLILLFAGFSNPAISFYMDLSDNAVRSRKKRYKQLFSTLPDARGSAYLRLLVRPPKP